jgi:NTP pyrophosphatase (non-canonical NTP hydrolase)
MDNDTNQETSLEQLVEDYRDIHLMLNAQWPLESPYERLSARMLKLTEELGELSNEVLTKMGLQRQSKIDAFKEVHLEDELADVMGSLILLAIELDIDVAKVMERKVAFTLERLGKELEDDEN